MFYIEDQSNALRFGDVLKGFPLTTPSIEKPILDNSGKNCNVAVKFDQFSVVMDPCCSIGEKLVSLNPLIKILDFFNNPYLKEDLTRVNREMDPEQSLSPLKWNSLPVIEKAKREAIGLGYAFLNLFIYQEHEVFREYSVNNKRKEEIKTNYFMIDFRNTYKLDCEKIVTPIDAPLEAKILELSIETRSELRNKISFYYGRIPKEDIT